jgi:transcriptional regulator with XRE-family HTH domain
LGVLTDKKRLAISSQVARILQDERQKRGLSMTLLAQRAGLSQQMVSYVEREMRNPSLDTLLRITSALDVDLSAVIRRAQQASLTKGD